MQICSKNTKILRSKILEKLKINIIKIMLKMSFYLIYSCCYVLKLYKILKYDLKIQKPAKSYVYMDR